MNKKHSEEKIISAYEKAANEGIDPRCIPQRLESPAPQHDEIVYPDYTMEEQVNWEILFNRQMELLNGRACEEYIE
ncbi:MAG: phenylalanine 4-monooxygenase, partial [Ignavibacteriota bacterium]